MTPPPETTPCTVTNVTNAWNGSDFGAVFWWTHGSSTSAADVMDLTHAATLDDAHPGFAFQCSCSNGTPEATNNLGYSLLKNGCISTVSASRVSWYEIGQTSFAGTATNSGMTFEYSQRLIAEEMYAGDALNDLKSDISPGFEELWMNYLDFNLYGCPGCWPIHQHAGPTITLSSYLLCPQHRHHVGPTKSQPDIAGYCGQRLCLFPMGHLIGVLCQRNRQPDVDRAPEPSTLT